MRAPARPATLPGRPPALWWAALLTGLARSLYPPRCVLCARAGADFCSACSASLDAGLEPACPQCAAQVPGLSGSAPAIACGACQRDRPAFDACIAAAVYAAPFDQLIVALKYRARLAYAPLLAQRLAERCTVSAQPAPDLLVAMPLARERLAERGFNQAEALARPLARQLGLPLVAGLQRVRATLAQASLDVTARRQNLRDAFAVTLPLATRVAGAHVGVVDDVMTTGSTLHEVARLLKRHGARRVTGLVIARTPRATALHSVAPHALACGAPSTQPVTAHEG